MLKLILTKDNFIQKGIKKNKYNYENYLYQVKPIHKNKKIRKNRSINLIKSKLIKRDINKCISNPQQSKLKNNQKNLKFKLLNNKFIYNNVL